MITIDYRNYLEQQSEWAESLRRVAKSMEPAPAIEMGEISAAALRRMIRFSCVDRYSGSQ